jgi:carboxyl-terminal processing protease
MPKTTKLIISALLVVVIALSFGAGFTFGRNIPSRLGEGLDTTAQAWNIILTDYVDPSRINTENMSQAAIEGMLKALDDPHTYYLEPSLYQVFSTNLEGSFDGIGVYVTLKNAQLTVISPIADSPADKAGMRAGDVIVEVNDEPVSEMSLAEAMAKIRGPRGTPVKLLVRHENETGPVVIEVIRSQVQVPSVRFEMKEDIAYINITDFSTRTGEEISPVIQDLVDDKATGIVLDLRGNPGGLLDAVIDVASHFLSDGTVVETRDRNGNMTKLKVKPGMLTTDLPLVVLTDNASASGSEVLAGALQDRHRATIAGTRTYGKGSVNILRRLNDGSGLYITTGRWLTPGGRLIEGQGIEPDIKLEVTGDDAITWALDYLSDKS